MNTPAIRFPSLHSRGWSHYASAGALLLAIALSLPALAQERAFLTKAQVEELASGKKWIFVRMADKQNVRWDLNSGGRLFGRNSSVGDSDSGTWLVNDSGQLCVKWRRSTDRCVALVKEGTTLKMVDPVDAAGTFADLTVE